MGEILDQSDFELIQLEKMHGIIYAGLNQIPLDRQFLTDEHQGILENAVTNLEQALEGLALAQVIIKDPPHTSNINVEAAKSQHQLLYRWANLHRYLKVKSINDPEKLLSASVRAGKHLLDPAVEVHEGDMDQFRQFIGLLQ